MAVLIASCTPQRSMRTGGHGKPCRSMQSVFHSCWNLPCQCSHLATPASWCTTRVQIFGTILELGIPTRFLCMRNRSRWSEQVRQLLCSHFGAMTWKMLYFLTTAVMCLLAFLNEPWWPQQIGGEGAEEELWQGKDLEDKSKFRQFSISSPARLV